MLTYHGELLYLPVTKSLSRLSECPQRRASSGRTRRPLSLAFLPTFLRVQQLCCVAEAYRAVRYAQVLVLFPYLSHYGKEVRAHQDRTLENLGPR
jgi:hypothetical protein